MKKAFLTTTICCLVALFGFCATGCESGPQGRLFRPSSLMERFPLGNSAPRGQSEPVVEVEAQ